MITHTAIQLIVNNLAAIRGPRIIFQNFNLAARSGDAFVIVGPNGAGKTTFLRCIAGLLEPFHGQISVTGTEEERSVGESCHYIGHLNGIKPALTVAENLSFFAHYLGDGAENIAAASDRLGLSDLEDIPAAYLSAGQKRRLGLARLLCAQRPIWLLDEPAVSLDTASQGILAEIVGAHLKAGGIVLAVTHMPLGWDDTVQKVEFESLAMLPDEGLE